MTPLEKAVLRVIGTGNYYSSDIFEEVNKKKSYPSSFKNNFRLKKEKTQKLLKVEIGSVDEQKKNGFKQWFEINNRRASLEFKTDLVRQY